MRTNYTNWTPKMDNQLRALFPKQKSKHVAEVMGLTLGAVNCRAFVLGLKKDTRHIQKVRKVSIKNLTKGEAYRFPKGHTPKNKGQKMPPDVRAKCEHTFFGTGRKPHNTKWDGYERLNAEGYIEVRVSERVFIGKHRLIWEQHHGAVPKGMCVIFADGDKSNFAIDNLVCVSRADLAILNKNQKYGREIAENVLLLTKIKNHLKTKKCH